MKKSLIFMIILSCLLSMTVLNANAAYTAELEIDSDIAYMISLDEKGTVIYEKNASKKTAPGALVKIVTGILAIESCPDPEQMITAKKELIRSLDGTGCTIAGILPDEQMTLRQLLYCMLVYNANDAALIIADHVAGSPEAFVAKMNEFAVKLGCKDTHFSNSNGFETPDQYTTAYDLSLIFDYCMKNSVFAEILSTVSYEMDPTNRYDSVRYLKTTNGLMNEGINDYFFKYVQAGKSAVTENDRCNSVSIASKDGYNYICIVLDGEMKDYDEDGVSENMSYISAKKLYEWTFDNIKLRTIANTSTYVGEVPVIYSKEYDYLSLVPANEVSALVPAGANAQGVLIEVDKESLPEKIKAPVKKGEYVGKASIKYAGQEIAQVDLVAAFDIRGNFFKMISYIFGQICGSLIFRILMIIVGSAAFCFLLLILKNSYRRYKKKHTIEIYKGDKK